MELNDILNALQYSNSPNFLTGLALESDRDFGHIFRKAQAECKLQGVYGLNGSLYDRSLGNVPVVYVCEADSETEAREIHRKVWNQNAVPFLLVVSRGWIRLYPGFRYDRDVSSDRMQGALKILEDFNQIAIQLKSLRAESVDSGLVWREMGSAVTPHKRVDWQLLANLRELDDWLRRDGIQDRTLAHSCGAGGTVGDFHVRSHGWAQSGFLARAGERCHGWYAADAGAANGHLCRENDRQLAFRGVRRADQRSFVRTLLQCFAGLAVASLVRGHGHGHSGVRGSGNTVERHGSTHALCRVNASDLVVTFLDSARGGSRASNSANPCGTPCE